MTWVKPGAIHITLRFLGEMPESSLQDINRWTEALDRIQAAPYSIQPINAFPDLRRPKVLFLDITPHEPFIALYQRLDTFLSSIGINAEDRPYQPHITLGRVKLPARSAKAPPFQPLSDTLTTVALFQSRLTPTGPIYTQLSTGSAIP